MHVCVRVCVRLLFIITQFPVRIIVQTLSYAKYLPQYTSLIQCIRIMNSICGAFNKYECFMLQYKLTITRANSETQKTLKQTRLKSSRFEELLPKMVHVYVKSAFANIC